MNVPIMETQERKFKPVKTPVDSIGTCKNARNCGNWKKTYLGNGYCMTCWDKGLGGGIRIPPHKKKGDHDQRN